MNAVSRAQNRAAITVRTALPAEWPSVGDLAERAYRAGGHVDPEYGAVVRDAEGRATPGPLLVAVLGEQIVGTVTLCPAGSSHAEICQSDELEFRFLAVDPEMWGHGIAGALVDAVIAHGRDIAATSLVCCVISWNDSAHRVYLDRGFRRRHDRDWTPVAGIDLWAYELMLS